MSTVHEIEMFRMRQRLHEGRKSFTDDMALFLKLAPLEALLPELESAEQSSEDLYVQNVLHDAHAVLGELARLREVYLPIVQQPHGPAKILEDKQWIEMLNKMLGLSDASNQ